MTWYLVCYTGMGNAISVARQFQSSQEAHAYIRRQMDLDGHVDYFILTSEAVIVPFRSGSSRPKESR